MELADGPVVQQIYRGFILSPSPEVDLNLLISVDYQVSSSTDNSSFDTWNDLGTVRKVTRFAFLHPDLYDTVYYAYRHRANWSDGSQSGWSDYSLPGNGAAPAYVDQQVDSIDEIADNLGIFEVGILRGIILETNKNYPKIRIDPSGIYGIAANGSGSTPLRFNASTGSLTLSGSITGSTITAGTITGTDITGGTINGSIITGGVFQTDVAGGARIYTSGNTMNITDDAGNIRTRLGGGTQMNQLRAPTGGTQTLAAGGAWHDWQDQQFWAVPEDFTIVILAGGTVQYIDTGAPVLGEYAAFRVEMREQFSSVHYLYSDIFFVSAVIGSFTIPVQWVNNTGTDMIVKFTLQYATNQSTAWQFLDSTGWYHGIIT